MKKGEKRERNYPTHRMSKRVLNRLIKYLKERKQWDSESIVKLIEYLTAE